MIGTPVHEEYPRDRWLLPDVCGQAVSAPLRVTRRCHEVIRRSIITMTITTINYPIVYIIFTIDCPIL